MEREICHRVETSTIPHFLVGDFGMNNQNGKKYLCKLILNLGLNRHPFKQLSLSDGIAKKMCFLFGFRLDLFNLNTHSRKKPSDFFC